MKICIYSRKSKWTGRGESVENQIQMCRDYIERNIPDTDTAEIYVYEDEGYSGKNTNRPQFQEMMEEIRKGNCSYLICYKLDRMGRNIIDIAGMVEELNRLQVSFISIKENFDTSTPLGKTMLYIAGIFAQMEREQIAERVRDNMLMLARSGRWLGGNTPLGFTSQKEKQIIVDGKIKSSFKLVENEQEIPIVKLIFQEFSDKQSLTKIVEHFLLNNIRTKRGREYTTTAIRDILQNPVYCTADKEAYAYFCDLGCQVCFSREEADGKQGILAYGRTSSAVYSNKSNPPKEWIIALGKHKGQITGKEFVRTQKLLNSNHEKGESYRKVRNEIALLSGLLYCQCGHAMRPKYYHTKNKTENGDRKFSYLCPFKDRTHGVQCCMANIQGNNLDEQICQELFRYAVPDRNVVTGLKELRKEFRKEKGERKEESVEKIVREFSNPGSAFRMLMTVSKREYLKRFIKRIEWDGESIQMILR